MSDLGLFFLRVTVGSLLAGHGAQKLFGWFEGPGLKGTSGYVETLGLRPGRPWAVLGGLHEFGGGTLTALGLLNPLGSIGVVNVMIMAWAKAHWGKPIWAGSGGAELPLINIAGAVAVAAAGPGRYSLDRMLGIRVPAWMTLVSIVGSAIGLTYAIRMSPAPTPLAQEAAETELQAGEEAAGQPG